VTPTKNTPARRPNLFHHPRHSLSCALPRPHYAAVWGFAASQRSSWSALIFNRILVAVSKTIDHGSTNSETLRAYCDEESRSRANR
jgi:hypothetical protein